ncbi:MAG: ATP-binding cassette domain-containing protein, partial [Planctomycetota bacterium]
MNTESTNPSSEIQNAPVGPEDAVPAHASDAEPVTGHDGGAPRPKILELIDVARTFQMGEVVVTALAEVTMEVFEGEFLVIVGPSGSGKSTLLN